MTESDSDIDPHFTPVVKMVRTDEGKKYYGRLYSKGYYQRNQATIREKRQECYHRKKAEREAQAQQEQIQQKQPPQICVVEEPSICEIIIDEDDAVQIQ